jgi:hypothetical protein
VTKTEQRMYWAFAQLNHARWTMEQIKRDPGNGPLIAAGWLRDFANDSHEHFRESGGSLPADAATNARKLHDMWEDRSADPPVLNKSGGCASVSEYSGRRCQKPAGHEGMHEDDATRWEDR